MSSLICPNCQQENRPGSKFCTLCGTKLQQDTETGPRLTILSGGKKDTVYTVKEGRTTIGRDIGNGLVINDEQISQYHAAVSYENQKISIEDLESKNGVFINGKQIHSKTVLPNGCLIKLGSTILKLETVQEASAE